MLIVTDWAQTSVWKWIDPNTVEPLLDGHQSVGSKLPT